MKTIDKIIESQEAPKDKNVLWVKGDKLLSHVNGKWTLVGGGSASAKNQDKSVEIVENGVTEVTADSGYTGLGKVTINANVQGGGESSIEYLDVSGLEAGMNKEYIVGLSRLMKDPNNEGILPPAFAALESSAGYRDAWNEVKEVCFDFSVEVNMQGAIYPIAQFLSMIGADLITIPRITKEQFYTL